MIPLFDSHVHLQPHGERPPVDRSVIECYVENAKANGLQGLAITEHLFRFQEAYDLLEGWWNEDPNKELASMVQRYWQDHVNLSLPEYVRLIEAAKSDGLPVSLGLEMDWIPGRAETLRALLAPYDWDVVLGSVHWIGAFGFDDEAMLEEWERRKVDQVFEDYAQLIDDLADSRLADVLAHLDLPKLFGHAPSDTNGFNKRLAAAAVRSGCAVEINTNGLRKAGGIYPSADLLALLNREGVAITLASDAHIAGRVGQQFDRAAEFATSAGYQGYLSFDRRSRVRHPLEH
jgi:histidinol-phosphatase (PHP family)